MPPTKKFSSLLLSAVVVLMLVAAVTVELNAQACGYVTAKFFISGTDGVVRNADIAVYSDKKLTQQSLHREKPVTWREEDGSYLLSEGMCSGHQGEYVRVRANGYEELSEMIDLPLNRPDKPHIFRVTLRRVGKTEDASIQEYSRLSGRIFDAQGSVIDKVSLSFVSGDTTFQSETDSSGSYSVELPFRRYQPGNRFFAEARYKIVAKKTGFKQRVVEEYIFVPSQFGEMQLDLALEILFISDPVDIPGKRTPK